MYELEINGRKLNYKINHHNSEYGDSHETVFFDKIMVQEKRWSWRKFRLVETGKMIEKNKTLFSLYLNLHDATYTKKEIREKLDKKIELLDRAEEIERGEVI